MIDLRQRTRSGSYSRLPVEEEDEDHTVIPVLNINKPKAILQVNTSNQLAKFCFVFSLIGVVFLTVVAVLLGQQSPYFKVSQSLADKKHELVRGVVGAIIMYSICAVGSGYVLYAAPGVKHVKLTTTTTTSIDSP